MLAGLDEDTVRDREEHEDREEDKTDQSDSEEEDDDKFYVVDDGAPPVETPYYRNSTEELGQVCLSSCPHYHCKLDCPHCKVHCIVLMQFPVSSAT